MSVGQVTSIGEEATRLVRRAVVDRLHRFAVPGAGKAEPITASTPFVLYLLHANGATGRKRHYLGIAATENLLQRLRRHHYGTGSKLCRRWQERHCDVRVAAVFACTGFAQERNFKANAHYNLLCPICLTGTAGCGLAELSGIVPRAETTWRPADHGR